MLFRSMENGAYFMADCTVNVEMNAEQLAKLAELAAETALSLGCEARVGMLSFSNFGSVDHAETDRKSTRLNSSHLGISYAVFCLKKKTKKKTKTKKKKKNKVSETTIYA